MTVIEENCKVELFDIAQSKKKTIYSNAIMVNFFQLTRNYWPFFPSLDVFATGWIPFFLWKKTSSFFFFFFAFYDEI